jgi:branched-chain amino acid transport system substrate-binding protein
MSKLRAALVTPLSGQLASFGRASSAGLTLWATQSANLPPPWTGVELEVRDTAKDPAAGH